MFESAIIVMNIRIQDRQLAIETFLNGSVFRYGIFPLVSAGSGVLLKCASRNDQYAFFKKEDMAVGPDLMLTAALAYVVITTDRARSLLEANEKLAKLLLADKTASTTSINIQIQELQIRAYNLSQHIASAAWTLLMLVLGLWSVATIVKRWGWQSETELRPIMGIGIPLIVGIVFIIIVMSAAKS